MGDNAVTGIVFITVDDELLQSKPGASLVLGGYERTEQLGHTFYGFSRKFVAAELECVISHKKKTDLIKMNGWEDVTVTFETDTDVTYVVSGSATVEPLKLTDGDGDVSLKLKGKPAVLA